MTTVHRKTQVAVVGGATASSEALALAEAVGAMLARHGIVVVTGGKAGVMQAAARGAARAGGLTVGIVPSADMAEANEWCQVVLPTGLGHARNALTALAGECVVAVGGAAGTLSEICLALVHGRPVLVLDGAGGWAEEALRAGVLPTGDANLTLCPDIETLERALLRFIRGRERESE